MMHVIKRIKIAKIFRSQYIFLIINHINVWMHMPYEQKTHGQNLITNVLNLTSLEIKLSSSSV